MRAVLAHVLRRVRPIFELPFSDLGGGVVSTRPSRGFGPPTFTRATTATTILSSGLIGSVASGSSRSCYSPTGVYLGYLAEGQRTNLALHSGALDNVAYTDNGTTRTANVTTAPDGALTATQLDGNGASSGHFLSGADGAGAKTFSGFAKKNTHDIIQLAVGVTTVPYANFDLTNGTAHAFGAGTTASIEAWPNGWYRCILSTTNASANGIRFIMVTSTASARSENNTIATNLYIWGAQSELATFASSYIPTTSAAVTRNADQLVYPMAGNFNDLAGTAYAEITAPAIASTSNARILCDAATGAGPLFITSAGQVRFLDGTNNNTGAAGITNNVLSKIASTWGGVLGSTFHNGVAATATAFDGSMAGVFASLQVGGDTTFDHAYGTVRNLKIFNRALTDVQVAQL